MVNSLAIENNDIPGYEDDVNSQYVTFYVADEVFGFPMASVLEIIRLPETIHVPLTPGALVGLANLRGSVLPVIDLRHLLQLDKGDYNDATRIIVTDVGTPVGLVVDRVARVMEVEHERIDNGEQVHSSINTAYLSGVIKSDSGEPLIQLLNFESLISQEFSAVLASSAEDYSKQGEETQHMQVEDEDDDTDQMVSFMVDGQEYAFDLMEVEEIVRIPESISRVPRGNDHVLGLIDLRGRLLPLVSMRKLFVLTETDVNENNRILVVCLKRNDGRKDSVGIVVDEVREVLRVDSNDRDTVPTLLTSQKGGDEIVGICRLDDGKRLVSVLCAESLFRHPAIQAAVEAQSDEEGDESMAEEKNQEMENEDDTEQLVVFHLGEQEYGVSIDDVQEITRVPEQLDRVPKTPDFIEGMVNLRGMVLPVLDMRTRFEMEKLDRNDRQRIIVLSLDGIRTGFIVDSVAEVLRLSQERIESAPNLSDDQARIMGQIINLKEEKRMIQVVTARELLSEQEIQAISDEK